MSLYVAIRTQWVKALDQYESINKTDNGVAMTDVHMPTNHYFNQPNSSENEK